MINPSAITQENKPQLILGSASPRRRELLQAMGCHFSVQSADIDEQQNVAEGASDYVARLALEKAQAAADLQLPSDHSVAILAADTIVVQANRIFGKPKDQADAFRMWNSLQDCSHTVITGVCLIFGDVVQSCLVQSRVEFGPISDQQMQRYWQSGEPLDKAGGYAIQGLASAWVKLIHGSYSNVVGLPLRETNQLLTLVEHNWL
jgi:septum formation protein